jgi:glycosyltransferase involved in cell wall biosynthesis
MPREPVILVCQRDSSSGLPIYLEDAFRAQGRDVMVVDVADSMLRRAWSLLRSVHPVKERWFRRREAFDYYSVAAWHRNSKANGRLVDRALRKGGRVLQIGGLYFPHPQVADLKYDLFFTYTMKLALADGFSPWVVRKREEAGFLALETELYQRARHIFVAANFVKEHLIAEYGVPSERISVVGMGVNDWYTAQMDAWPRPPSNRLLFVGFTWGLKGGPDVVRAFRMARVQVPDLTLTIVGPRPAPEMRAEGVYLAGEVLSKKELLAHYRSADVFVLPSRCDSFGFVFLEAMTQGLVCIGSNLNAMPEIIEDGETGFLVEPGDVEALARRIVELAKNRERKLRMGTRARDRVLQRFTWSRVVSLITNEMFAGADS